MAKKQTSSSEEVTFQGTGVVWDPEAESPGPRKDKHGEKLKGAAIASFGKDGYLTTSDPRTIELCRMRENAGIVEVTGRPVAVASADDDEEYGSHTAEELRAMVVDLFTGDEASLDRALSELSLDAVEKATKAQLIKLLRYNG